MREAVKNTLLAAAIFLLALVLSILIQTLGVREHVTTVFVFAVFLISLLTEGYVYGVVSAVAGADDPYAAAKELVDLWRANSD